jgi:hypothetical protein
MLPVVFVLYLLIIVFVYPLILVGAALSSRGLARKRVTFSDHGVAFARAYRRLIIPWNRIVEVVRHREPAAIFFRIVTDIPGAPSDGYVAITDEDEEFERLLAVRDITFRYHDFHNPQNA